MGADSPVLHCYFLDIQNSVLFGCFFFDYQLRIPLEGHFEMGARNKAEAVIEKEIQANKRLKTD